MAESMVTDTSPATRQLKDIIDSLTDLGYEGPLLQEGHLESCIVEGVESVEFIQFITWLSNDISKMLELEESITTGLGPDDANVFKLEVKGFLSALQCPYRFLTKDLDVLSELEHRYAILEYLTSELQATKLIVLDHKDSKVDEHQPLTLAHDATITVLQGLQCSQPPAHVTFDMITSKILEKVQTLAQSKPNYFGTPLIDKNLNLEQWTIIKDLNMKLEEEFRTRRQLLLTRLDVTLQAFTWKKETAARVEKVIKTECKIGLDPKCTIPISHLIAARTDLAHQSKTSNTSVLKNTHTTIHKYKMGNVPDRGGRAWETRPPPEMPSFQPRVEHAQPDIRGGRQTKPFQRSFNSQNQFQANRQYSHDPSQHYHNEKPAYQTSASYTDSHTQDYVRETGTDYYEARESRGNPRGPRGGDGGYHRRGGGNYGRGGMISRDQY